MGNAKLREDGRISAIMALLTQLYANQFKHDGATPEEAEQYHEDFMEKWIESANANPGVQALDEGQKVVLIEAGAAMIDSVLGPLASGLRSQDEAEELFDSLGLGEQ